ncbi:hypothetical protein [Blastococcus montanus]|uniref:hypothetical protein n=1 Tax=Blastococcus montanus TaxID=3144973 RepID=UPI00320B7582
MTESRPSSRRLSPLLLVVVLAGVAVTVGAFAVLDWVAATGVAAVVLTAVAMVVAGWNWESHATFEERELARARRRARKWDRNAGARARDRARWEAHQARKAAQARATGSPGSTSGSTASGTAGAPDAGR